MVSNRQLLWACMLSLTILNSVAWPGMRASSNTDEDYIGPACTVGAHNWHPESGPCPNMEQPLAPTPSSNHSHVWPSNFIVDWAFYFVPDDTDAPPYVDLPTTPYNKTTGKTYYFDDEGGNNFATK